MGSLPLAFSGSQIAGSTEPAKEIEQQCGVEKFVLRPMRFNFP